MPASRSVVSMLVRELGDFLYILKAGPAGGRLRRPSSPGRRLAPHCAGTCVWIARSESGGNEWPQSRAKTSGPGRCRR
jgi:hypothetical protein